MTSCRCQDLLPFFPKCLYGDDEMVVMNNLVLDDTWIMLDKEEGQDLETAKLVLTNLAKFHAASFAYIQKEFGSREKFLEEWETVCVEAFLTAKIPMMDEIFENGIKTCLSILNVGEKSFFGLVILHEVLIPYIFLRALPVLNI